MFNINVLFRFLKKRSSGIPLSRTMDHLYRHISYRFVNLELFEQAMTHRSSLKNGDDRVISNERLEFLGDAILGMLVTDELFDKFRQASEGELTRIKSTIVSRERLAQQARHIGLGQFVILGNGEEKSGGRNRLSILADVYEALLGAIYLDGGIDEARRFVCSYLLRDIDSLGLSRFHQNYKSWLLEYCQSKDSSTPEYLVCRETGPDHKKEFSVEVYAQGKKLGHGIGPTKKKAEQEAARMAIQNLGLRDESTGL